MVNPVSSIRSQHYIHISVGVPVALFSPVVNPWYLVWLLPYAALRPSCWAWTASIIVSLSYITGLNLADSDLLAYQVAAPARIIEMAGIAVALLIDYRRGEFRVSSGNQRRP